MRDSCLALLVATVAVLTQPGAPPALAQGRQPDPDHAALMRDHFGQVLVVHAAVIRGDLSAVAAPARELAGRVTPPNAPPGTDRAIAAMSAAARRAEHATSVLEAATATSAMLTACGDCHRAAGIRPEAPLPAPSPVGGVVGHMLQHQRAAEQMMHGLMLPSTAQWREGATAFGRAPLHPQDLPVDSAARRQMAATEERLHRTAGQAVETTDPLARENAYALILAACADCHRDHPKVWGRLHGWRMSPIRRRSPSLGAGVMSSSAHIRS